MEPSAIVTEADFTLSFQFPKLSFLFPESYFYVGEWDVADIGLHEAGIQEIETDNHLIDEGIVKSILRPRSKFAHKGDFGHGLLVAGSKGMMGAAVLAAKACLRSGIGRLTVHSPAGGSAILQATTPEAMCTCDAEEDHFSGVEFKSLPRYNAIAIGPGLGNHLHTKEGLMKLIGDFGGRLIFDADAINILAENKTWLEFLPPNCIFTPHPKEFERLTQPSHNSFERMEIQRAFSVKHRCIVVLKGAHTCISSPDGKCYFNASGNPGMATGGSGDVLTGMILGLVAQGYTSLEASLVGVYLHGKAGDIALDHQSQESLLPTDIIENVGQAFRKFA
jgi:NAD(P)H-hydrate epimerase